VPSSSTSNAECSARGVIHRHHQVERRPTGKPSRPRAVLVQHHALARLALTLASMRRTTTAQPRHQVGCLQLGLDPAVAPRPAVRELQMLVEVLHVPPRIVALVLVEHPRHLVDRDPSRRRLAQRLVDQALQPVLFVAPPITPKLPLRAAQERSRLGPRQLPVVPSASISPRTSPSVGPATTSSGSSISSLGAVLKPDNSCATKPDNSCAYDTWN
jgi:hypothetical protein